MKTSQKISIIALLIAIIALLIIAHYFDQQTHVASQTQGITAHWIKGPADIYPDPTRTPGATNPTITQANIDQTICNPSWSTKSIRPPVTYTNPLKVEQIQEYDYQDTNPQDYEEDHLISLELGGNPTDPQNLWPEPYSASIADGGAKIKDTVENYLHKEVCSGTITLQQAQKEISTDWYAVYQSMHQGIGGVVNSDDPNDN